MKPKTKEQKRVMELFNTLPPISEKASDWLQKQRFSTEGKRCKGEIWCQNCGGTFASDAKDKVECPHCGTQLKLKASRAQHCSNKYYYTIVTTHKGYQVCRHFSVYRTLKKGKEPNLYIDEVVQNWINDKGKETIVARITVTHNLYADLWDLSKPMEIRHNNSLYYHSDKYYINSKFIYPYQSVLPIFRRNGYTAVAANATCVAVNKLLLQVMSDYRAETLIKNKQYALLRSLCNHGGMSESEYTAAKIAIRNRYIIRDAQMYRDYIRML